MTSNSDSFVVMMETPAMPATNCDLQNDLQHEFRHRLGGGGQGDVYLAKDKIKNELVAIKVPKVSGDISLDYLEEALEEELRRLLILCPSTAPHPNIVEPRGVKRFKNARGGDLLGIITEFVPGEPSNGKPMGCDLMQYARMAGEPPRNLQRLIPIIVQICNALTHAHTHREQILHRDIKPGNIVIRTADGTAKLTDWGIAKIMKEKENENIIRKANEKHGTPPTLVGTPGHANAPGFRSE